MCKIIKVLFSQSNRETILQIIDNKVEKIIT